MHPKELTGIMLFHEEERGREFLEKITGKKPVFVCVIGTTDTAKIPGISAAGKTPELTEYTPAADVELLILGRCKCIDTVPVTPEGIPTPAIITLSALRLAHIPVLVVDAGARIKPQVPFISLGGFPGKDIRSGSAVVNVEEVFLKAKVLGEQLSMIADYLVVGESIPGGTTTALAVLLALGVNARGKVSSSMPHNPHDLKIRVVEQALKAAGVSFGQLGNNPLKAISLVGDPVMPAFAGIVVGAAKRIPVLMAGGTQMCAILKIVKELDESVVENIAIGTTRWIVHDKTSDIKGLVEQIADVPILAANIDFSKSRFDGLRAYERGAVKEGVGAGGAVISAIAKTRGGITVDDVVREVEKNYELLLKRGQI